MSMGGLIVLGRYCEREQARLYEQGHKRRLKLQRHRKIRRERLAFCDTMKQRLRQSEDDLGAMLLLAAGVRWALLEAGLLDRADLVEAIRRLDLLDGVADGKLNPAATRPAPNPKLSTEAFLAQLAEQDRRAPRSLSPICDRQT